MEFGTLNAIIQSALVKVAEDEKEEKAEDEKDEKAEKAEDEKAESKKEEKEEVKAACLAFLVKTACGLSSTPEGKAKLEAAEKQDPEGFRRNFEAGLKVEQEHGADKAEITTKDHMVENPGYYDAFAKVKGALEGEKKAWVTVHALSAKIAASLADAKTEVTRKPSPYPPQRGQEKTEPYRNPNTGKPVFNTMQALRKQMAPA